MTLSEVHSFWGVAETIAGSLLCCGDGIRDLKIQRRDGNENVLKTILLIGKTTTLYVHQASFLHISLPFLQDYDVKMPNFVFHGEDKRATRKFYFAFWTWIRSLENQIQEDSRTFDKVSKWEESS